MIDLHLHTTASDGTDSPAELVRACRDAGITAMAVTDHDTTAATLESAREAERAGITFVAGIEITAAWEGSDVHLLGYFIDREAPVLVAFLEAQIKDRIRRARAVGERLVGLGAPIDMDAIIARAEGRPVLRPHIAQALVSVGHAVDEQDAFDRFVGEGRPAYVARRGATPTEVVAIIRQAGGISSMAHPGVTRQDRLIPGLAAAGLDALEAYHTDHSAEETARYLAMARQIGLCATGGSDFHGFRSAHSSGFGTIQLPAADFAALRGRRSQ
ncbi:MAG: PHP domain-containing protein [Vicinamibacterales bacterium]